MGNVNPRPYGRQASSTSVTDLSTRPHEDLEDDIAVSNNNTVNNNAQSGNPSRTTGLYFGGPLFMGNNPRAGNSEAVNRELSFLTSLGGRPPAPQVHQVVTVRCPVNLTKTSLQLIPVDESNKNLYRVQFLFDSTEEGTISILYGVTESISDSSQIVFNPPSHNGSKPFERGLGQLYEQPPSEYLDITKFKEEDLAINSEKSYYPVVIILASTHQPDKNDQSNSKVALQITYASLIHCADDTYVIKPMKQKIRYNGKSYIIHDIYGLESVDTDGGRECVICMTEPRDTTVLPCRHMCLCNSCAEVLRHQSNKCPICRSTVKSMIEIKINKHADETCENSEDEEPVLVKKSKQHRATEDEDETTSSAKTETSQDEM